MLFIIFWHVYQKKISIGKYSQCSTNQNKKRPSVAVTLKYFPHQNQNQNSSNLQIRQKCWILFIYIHELYIDFGSQFNPFNVIAHCIQKQTKKSNGNVKYSYYFFIHLICSISSFLLLYSLFSILFTVFPLAGVFFCSCCFIMCMNNFFSMTILITTIFHFVHWKFMVQFPFVCFDFFLTY